MSTKTKCEKCLFSDYASSPEPCAMNIIEKIDSNKTIEIVDNFYQISHYRCPFAFSIDVYKENIDKLGSIDNLKHQLIDRAQIDYYMIIFLDTDDLDEVCASISELPISPKFVSFIIQQNNDTGNIIARLNEKLPKDLGWKLHNFLEVLSFQDSLDTVFKTNTHTSNITYFWINDSKSFKGWGKDISVINSIIVLEQPFLHALFRSDHDGIFLTFNNYEQILKEYGNDILSAIDKIENKSIRYYA